MKNLFAKIKLADGSMILQPLEEFAKDIDVEIVELAPEKVETGKKRGRPRKEDQ